MGEIILIRQPRRQQVRGCEVSGMIRFVTDILIFGEVRLREQVVISPFSMKYTEVQENLFFLAHCSQMIVIWLGSL